MTSVQERLRAAAEAAAGTVTEADVPPLRLPDRRRRTVFGRFHGAALVTAPTAAAAALAVVATVVAALHAAAGSGAGAGGSGAALRLLPPYQVSLTFVGQLGPRAIQRTEAVVTATRTGKKLAVIAPPNPYNAFTAVTGSADGRVYVLAAQRLTKPDQQHGATALYELRIGSESVALRPLPTPVLRAMTVNGIALSPDGSRLAVTGTWPLPIPVNVPTPARDYNHAAGVRLYDLTTGMLAHNWYVVPPPLAHACCQFSPGLAEPSWQDGGRYLALDADLGHCEGCVVRLDTRSAVGSVQAAARVIVRTHNRHYSVSWSNTLITPDGRRVVRSAGVFIKTSGHSGYEVARVFTYSARSGAMIARLRGGRGVDWKIEWTSPSGRGFVVTDQHVSATPPNYLTDITAALYWRGHWTPVHLPARAIAVAW